MFVKTSKKFFKRPLYIQLLFTFFAFLSLNLLTYIFVSNLIYKNLSRNAESVLLIVQTQIENDLNNPKTYLAGFSRTVRAVIMRGNGKQLLKEYFSDLSNHLLLTKDLSGFDKLFGYFITEPDGNVFIQGFEPDIPMDINFTDRRWYKNAIAGNGSIAETIAYHEIYSGENILFYSICIYDDDGNYLGVICMSLNIGVIGERVVKTTIGRNGWGMLISNDLIVLAHKNEHFVGIDARNPAFPASIFTPQMIRKENTAKGSMISFLGEKSLTFFRRLSNGWYLGLTTPEKPYYRSLTTLAYILGILGVFFAGILMIILIKIDTAKNKSDMESKHKSAFLANMSHEIRTPMNAIIGMITIGKSAVDTERKNYCFEKIQEASNHLLGVINDILDMSKIEANKFELAPVEFEFEKMLHRTVDVINFRIEEKHQKLTVYIDSSIPRTLVGDDQRITQVITNLFGNAVKFTPEHGAISLTARLLERTNSLCTLQISVSDTGIGISEEQKTKIFQSFEQAESSTTRKYGGTGLGLSISKRIVEMMGGRIWVESEPGKGSTFTFTIKLTCGAEERQKRLLNVNLKKVRIMVVDDDQDILTYFSDIAQGFGLSCETAKSGKKALELIKQKGGYHIYFLDWKIPDIDGIQLAREIKTHSAEKTVVIMISASEWNVIADEAKSAGVDKFLSKPLFPSSIAEVINECLGADNLQAKKLKAPDISGIFTGRRILLAEDVEINREIVKTLLDPTQLKIDFAENGAEAVRMFTETPLKYDMIFMDIQMPIMDGYLATNHIRAVEEELRNVGTGLLEGKTRKYARNLMTQIPIIAMTANVFKEDVEKCLASGMNGHVGKPLDIDEVISKLRLHLNTN
ncbi:MAG: response regulator [Treponema sp.]|nr:response regulator [Treponema sp.]